MCVWLTSVNAFFSVLTEWEATEIERERNAIKAFHGQLETLELLVIAQINCVECAFSRSLGTRLFINFACNECNLPRTGEIVSRDKNISKQSVNVIAGLPATNAIWK